ncbi:MAG: hypothetical protein WCW44_02985 [archaeon]|jgi:hypothetical protein
MPLRRSFSLEDVRQHIANRYGRDINYKTLRKRAGDFLGPNPNERVATRELTPKQAAELSRHIIENSQRLPLSGQRKQLILKLLQERASSNLYDKKTVEMIAKQASHPKSPISVNMLNNLNKPITAMRGGKRIHSARTYDPRKVNLVSRMKSLLEQNPTANRAAIAAELGLDERTLQYSLNRLGTSFSSQANSALKKSIREFDLKTNRKLTAEEIAVKFNVSEDTVRRFWKRSKSFYYGQQTEAVASEALAFISLFTAHSPKLSYISLSELREMTQSYPVTLNSAIKQLKQQRLVTEIRTDHPEELIFPITKGERYFFVNPKGFIERSRGAKVANPSQRQFVLESMPLDRLEKLHDQIVAIQNRRNLGEHGAIVAAMDRIIGKKRLDLVNGKAKGFTNRLELKK